VSDRQLVTKKIVALSLTLLAGCADYCNDSWVQEINEARKHCLNTANCVIDVAELRRLDTYEKRCGRIEQ
jgi:hypothetical protein